MGILFTTLISLIFIFKLLKVKNAYKFYILLIPFIPRYIGFGISGGSLSLKRVFLLLLFIISTVLVIKRPRYLSVLIKVYYKNKLLINIFLFLFIIKIISQFLNNAEIKSIIMIFNDFLFSFFVCILTILFINNTNDLEKTYKVVSLSFLLALLIGYIEYSVKHPVYTVFAIGDISSLQDINRLVFRENLYRVSGSFVNSLVLGQFLVIIYPIVISFFRKKKYYIVSVPLISILFLGGVYITHSRAAWLMVIVMIYLYISLKFYSKGKVIRYIINIINLFIILIVLYFSFMFIMELINEFTGFTNQNSAADNSLYSRAIQFVNIYEGTMYSLFFGNGRIIDFESFGKQIGAIDNYFLLIFYETGIIGLIFYLFFMYLILRKTINLYKKKVINKDIIISLILIIIYQAFISIPDNLIYMYILLGIVLGLTLRRKMNYKKIDYIDINRS